MVAPKLTRAVKEELSEQALAMSCKGRPFTEIAQELEVNWKTAKGLVEYALDKRDIDEDAERQRSLAHHREILRWCWGQLEGQALKTNAQNRPAYIGRIQHSLSEIDRLNGLRSSDGSGVNVNVNVNGETEVGRTAREIREIDRHIADLDGEIARIRAAKGGSVPGEEEGPA